MEGVEKLARTFTALAGEQPVVVAGHLVAAHRTQLLDGELEVR